MKTRTTITFWLAAVGAVAAVGCVVGCEDKRRHRPSTGVIESPQQVPVARDASPAGVVQAFIGAVQEAQRVRAGGLGTKEKKEAYDRAMATVGSLMARAKVHEAMLGSKSPTLPANLTEQAAVTVVSESWVSIAAYYADGFMFETLQAPAVQATPDAKTVATIEAVRPEDQARLDKIEQTLIESPLKDANGKPVARDTDAYLRMLRARALGDNPPFNVPVRAQFRIELWYTADGWRVLSFSIEPSSMMPRRTPPLAKPAVAPTPQASQPSMPATPSPVSPPASPPSTRPAPAPSASEAPTPSTQPTP